MRLKQVIERIESRVPCLRGRTAGAAAFVALLQQGALPQQTPAAHVIPSGMRGGQVATITGLTRQSVTESFAVILTIRSHDRVGDGALEPLDALVRDVTHALVGWQPEGAIDAFALSSGAPVSMTAGTLVYQLEFFVTHQLRIPTDA